MKKLLLILIALTSFSASAKTIRLSEVDFSNRPLLGEMINDLMTEIIAEVDSLGGGDPPYYYLGIQDNSYRLSYSVYWVDCKKVILEYQIYGYIKIGKAFVFLHTGPFRYIRDVMRYLLKDGYETFELNDDYLKSFRYYSVFSDKLPDKPAKGKIEKHTEIPGLYYNNDIFY